MITRQVHEKAQMRVQEFVQEQGQIRVQTQAQAQVEKVIKTLHSSLLVLN